MKEFSSSFFSMILEETTTNLWKNKHFFCRTKIRIKILFRITYAYRCYAYKKPFQITKLKHNVTLKEISFQEIVTSHFTKNIKSQHRL